ncbi:hypothetical protein M406DRAFT_72694 [Cryphonectria parasitica EP155]|uniref:Uncharacterized protein n=1 Tax=Cryphonectria parasitica (strain ATCC 38755 / EP155) TaxID=660469 RepID=A0A9P4XWP8_CRYP1|nr:uncharacterized protein M406DRAFT_72694 [Cryphonectria parasitica EP155]KAF3762712.1 hypothetical protein M406DRAFT_72694 [Cryphonectria parasitica EP155]
MCLIVRYICQVCGQPTGQRDYITHTRGLRCAIPNPNTELVTFCPGEMECDYVMRSPVVKSWQFACKNSNCLAQNMGFYPYSVADEHLGTSFLDPQYLEGEKHITRLLEVTAEQARWRGGEAAYNDVRGAAKEYGEDIWAHMEERRDLWRGVVTRQRLERMQNPGHAWQWSTLEEQLLRQKIRDNSLSWNQILNDMKFATGAHGLTVNALKSKAFSMMCYFGDTVSRPNN